MDYYGKCLVNNEYIVINAPSNLPLSIDLVKQHLYIDASDTSQDEYITLLISAVSSYCEKYTKLTLITTGFETFRDGFCGRCIELRKAPFAAVNSIMYLVGGVNTLLDSDEYYVTSGSGYNQIYESSGYNWPCNVDDVVQSVTINFDAGFGPDDSFIPSDLKIAMLNHIARMYSDRGDCSECGCEACLPPESSLIYEMYRIKSLNASPICRLSC